ncbi:MAG: 3-oxoacyl-ACP reductase FabG [Candidatus Methanoliparum thermophilum]|uniref:3-oxoacyl-ACP reductase FabG n=1 Tax=Methanoliparum thermophilum TaxID=2491083 RepID=A0A520KTT2_METT2|nr:3-oxoacyl-ACP reductase family protein [Candidatus Methanoliparum sp. LAM-1]7X5J_A Chain A, 3-oxoacyl-ACP reductase [Candidatus Methanoliparum]7X5J_B Chain B, 3-oxoacyl-ACP reductase [Candidatus Methanoliparum]7X5J_C Chain C, 3-oxoacyl-ACP reductase [Candidatus Methanoliparum]7X5J_D Chain D, 3-oxoacyl-ACP reductase [Candidatus Methanoliparum]7X5J_E Chain E, 3-oxoacyl-ACP reductase [Candidatus Methanoliparum]7X5J_F Chain F, 3-oxoacyl-ACP reductase [Candidatus Methanoliparum]RZN65450.1 MAG:
MSLQKRVALVTGGSGGLGRVHALTLAQNGADVAVTGNRNIDKAESVANEIRALGRKALAIKVDVSNEDEVNEGVEKIKKELGSVDILVNNAASGIVRATLIEKTAKEDWDQDLRVNLTGAFNCIKAVIPDMKKNNWGRIINISSVTGTMGGSGQCSYATTKAGLIGLTKTVALEGARYNITCNALVLGVFGGRGREDSSFYDVAEPFRERIIKRTAMRRPGDPKELSNVLAFLASDEASYVTGDAIVVGGGIDLFTF